jgi:hypothetical protein
MVTQEETMGLLKQLAEQAEKIQWTADNLGGEVTRNDPSARAFTGKVEGWHVLVVSFSIENQGYPRGSRSYDGTGVRKQPPVVLRFTRELAEKLFKVAEAQPTPTELAKTAVIIRLAKKDGDADTFPDRLRLELRRTFGPETKFEAAGTRLLVKLTNGHVIPVDF